jgi:hypothetical protein
MGQHRHKEREMERLVEAGPTERIDPSELRYLLLCRQRLGQVPQIEAQVEQLERQRDGIIGALESYGAYLAEQYGLDVQRDRIEDDGRIARAMPASVAPAVPAAAVSPNGQHQP